MRRNRLWFTAILMCILFLLTSCGMASSPMDAGEYPEEVDEEVSSNSTSLNVGSVAGSNRKIIVSCSYELETKDLDKSIKALEKTVSDVGGYFESSTINGNTASDGYGEFVVRIPSDKLDTFTQGVSGWGNVVSQSRSGEDVTTQYFDIEAELTSLKVKQERLLALLEKAESLSDILQIETELTTVRTSIESLTTELKKYDNLIQYSTVNINMTQVEVFTDLTDGNFSTNIVRSFSNSFSFAGTVLGILLTALIWLLPYILISVVIFIIVWIIIKHRKKKKQSLNR